jgi:phosphoribosyl 1,2-cyclic phosphodiesterase
MLMQFVVLGSGSAGNSSYLHGDGFGLLIDVGLGPRQIEARLASGGLTWAQVRAVLLTHTHGDHWHERTLALMAEKRIPLYCHPDHQRNLMSLSPAVAELTERGLVFAYEAGVPLRLTPRLSCLPFRVQHDSTMTCGFRFEGASDLFGQSTALAYCSDLGTWTRDVAEVMSDVEVLAVEFNHDVTLQRSSNRSRRTIARNLGNKGHLSNEQAAALVREVLRLSASDCLRHIVQLHLSQECNRPALAAGVLQPILAAVQAPIQIHTARQDEAGPHLIFGESADTRSPLNRKAQRLRKLGTRTEPIFDQPMLPGWDSE